jgi:hypothetical protein
MNSTDEALHIALALAKKLQLPSTAGFQVQVTDAP